MNIDWDRIKGVIPRPSEERAPATFSQDQIDAAVKAAQALPAVADDPNVVATFWPAPPNMPTLADLDFADVPVGKTALSTLFASNPTLKRDDLIWHIERPGKRKHANPFTAHPMLLVRKNTTVIIDGQHCLAALSLLGQTSWPCFLIPQ